MTSVGGARQSWSVRWSRTFVSKLRSPRLTSQLGVALGIAFGVCFVTGYVSHAIQHPPWWFAWPSRPVSLYRVTQGTHVATGLAALAVLAAKVWAVAPRLLRWPSWRDVPGLLERAGVLLLVAASVFQLTTGVLNIARWYDAMGFSFTVAHYWTAWLAIGTLLVHVGVKLPVVRRALTAPVRPVRGLTGLSRRGLLGGVAATAGVVTVATVGQTVRPLAALSVLAPRDPRVGPQGLPVNKSAVGAGVVAVAGDPGYRLEVVGPGGTLSLSLADLAARPQHTVDLPITCVEGWSAGARWSGPRLRELVAEVGADARSQVTVVSLEQGSPYASSVVDPDHLQDPLTLLALRLRGEPLHLDHGYPCRLIAPSRPGVLQTKWVHRLLVERAR
ncbi:molybdopterin-dependent oxidoreductase [Kitasatospora sp. NPDC051853]|uniref:molybdopterin-dependent oxidoreductase n=1 Tax=Kitasatospora sp. NPDC051853 TaxID=3364058 RepID=UPI0037B7FBBD